MKGMPADKARRRSSWQTRRRDRSGRFWRGLPSRRFVHCQCRGKNGHHRLPVDAGRRDRTPGAFHFRLRIRWCRQGQSLGRSRTRGSGPDCGRDRKQLGIPLVGAWLRNPGRQQLIS
jgi:hypothetical protein